MFVDQKKVRQVLWHFPQTNTWWILPQAEDTADILVEPSHTPHTTEPPPPCLNILHLFNYLAATLWLGPELQWKLYLPIRAGLVTGAGQISLSCRLREKEMPLATLRRRKCHYLIAGLSFPGFGLPGTVRICLHEKVCAHNSVTHHTWPNDGERLSVLHIKLNLKNFLFSS